MRDIVLDTNCLLACIANSSKFHSVWTCFLNEEFRLCVSNEIMTEYEEIIARKTSSESFNETPNRKRYKI